MPGPIFTSIPASYLPAYKAGFTNFVKGTVTNAAQRLNAIAAIPLIPDERYTWSSGPQLLRAPYHVLLQVPAAAANPVYITWDNNTAPVVGGPGLELEQGTIYKFESAGVNLLYSPTSATQTLYPYAVGGAFRLIAAANTTILVAYSD